MEIPKNNIDFHIVTWKALSNDEAIVYAVRDSNPKTYVTWWYKIGSGFFWGHYTTNKEKALKDFDDRIKNSQV